MPVTPPFRGRRYAARWSRSGLLWTAVAVALIEFVFSFMLPGNLFRHEVDVVLHKVATRQFESPILSLGDSVGHQLDRGIEQLEPGFLSPLSSNGTIEMAGQYLLLLRYLERNPPPQKLVLWVDDPFHGDLDLIYTENFVERCFLRWHEIGMLGWWKCSPAFTANMLAYKLLPSYRYRMELQQRIPFLEVRRVQMDFLSAARDRDALHERESFPTRAWRRLVHGEHTISALALERLLAHCESLGIQVYVVPTPIREYEAALRVASGETIEMNARLAALSRRFTVLRFRTNAWVYPDEMFPDGSHFAPQYVPARAREYLDLLRQWFAEEDAHRRPARRA
ncbi:MAG TPA: hypothetical protein PKE12_12805 [Kiritimatiellia bacterium]|nr:hypothetical protein [Kiritimatiellia bacterium]